MPTEREKQLGRERCKRYREKLRTLGKPRWDQINIEHHRASNRARKRKDKAELYTALGNACATCGETDPLVFTLDHIHGDGWMDARRTHSNKYARCATTPAVSLLKRKDFKTLKARFQILCANCHMRKTRLHGEYDKISYSIEIRKRRTPSLRLPH